MGDDGDLDSSIYRFSTDYFPERDRITQWRETCGRAIMKVDMEPLGGVPFRCTAELRQLPHLGIASITTTPNRLTRGGNLVAEGNDDFIFVIPTAGQAEISQRNQDVTLKIGSALLVRNDEPSATFVSTQSRFVSLAIPATILTPLVAGIDTALMPVIPNNIEAVRLLVNYVSSLGRDITLSAFETRRLVANHIHDLVALAVGSTRDVAEIAHGGGVRAARLRAIKAYVRANLGRHDLSTTAAALSQGVTPRYVRKLFENDGTSFSKFVLDLRLDHVRSLIENQRFLGRTISAVAFDCGFNDLSYFNRAFRHRFGMTPSDVRAKALR